MIKCGPRHTFDAVHKETERLSWGSASAVGFCRVCLGVTGPMTSKGRNFIRWHRSHWSHIFDNGSTSDMWTLLVARFSPMRSTGASFFKIVRYIRFFFSSHFCASFLIPSIVHSGRYTDSSPTDSSPTVSSPTESSPTGQFADRTIRRQDSSPTGQFTDRTFHRQDGSPTGLFADRMFRR